MRQIVLDTETTGLEVGKGHRIIEIGGIELAERRPTGRTFHRYLNPQRAIDEGARAVHGIGDDFLADKPRFADVATEFIAFIDGAELVIHNAVFDIAFLDNELELADPQLGRIDRYARVLDTLPLAREKYPGQRINLDALCKRLNVDNRHRELHGALLDAQLLTDVYLAMTGGQGDLSLVGPAVPAVAVGLSTPPDTRLALRVRRADADEAAAHAARLQAIDKASAGRCLWRLDDRV